MFFVTDQGDLINIANTTKISRSGQRINFHYLGSTQISVDFKDEKTAKDLVDMFSMQFAVNQIPENVESLLRNQKVGE